MTLRIVLPLVAAVTLIGSAASADPTANRAFLEKAIKGDNSEIMLGKLAQTRGDKTKDFGQTLVSDHTASREQAATLAKAHDIPVPTQPMAMASHERMKLEHLSGAAFDREFARYMVNDHEHDIADFKKEAAAGSGPFADFARQTLPTLHKHLDMAKSLAG